MLSLKGYSIRRAPIKVVSMTAVLPAHRRTHANYASVIAVALVATLSVLLVHVVALSDVHAGTHTPPTTLLHGETTAEIDTVGEGRGGAPPVVLICLSTVVASMAVALMRESCTPTSNPGARLANPAELPLLFRTLAFLGIQRR